MTKTKFYKAKVSNKEITDFKTRYTTKLFKENVYISCLEEITKKEYYDRHANPIVGNTDSDKIPEVLLEVIQLESKFFLAQRPYKHQDIILLKRV